MVFSMLTHRNIFSLKNRTVSLCLSPPVTAIGWRQIYTEAKDWKALLDSTSVSRKGACCLFSHAVSSLSIIPFCGFALFLLFVLPTCSRNKSFITSVCLCVCLWIQWMSKRSRRDRTGSGFTSVSNRRRGLKRGVLPISMETEGREQFKGMLSGLPVSKTTNHSLLWLVTGPFNAAQLN